MKTVNPIIIGYDISCLVVILLIPFISKESITLQVINFGLIILTVLGWLRGFLLKNRNRNRLFRFSWYLQSLTVGLSVLMMVWGIAQNFVR